MWNEITSKNNNELLVGYLQEEPDCERLLAVLSWDRNEQSNDNVSMSVFTVLQPFMVIRIVVVWLFLA